MYDLRDEADVPIGRGYKVYRGWKRASMMRRDGDSKKERKGREEKCVRSGNQTGQEMLP